jgi:SAM-dependent methyltransferase
LPSSTDTRPDAESQFLTERPRDLAGRQPPWHRLAYIVQELPRAIERLVSELDDRRSARVLDYGCGDLPYRHLFSDADYVAADLPGNPRAAMEISSDGRLSALGEEAFDVVLSTQVLEHVSDPRVYLEECYRVLRPDGRLLLSTHGLMVYHPDPVDYWRWTCAGLQEQVRRAGFEVIRFEGIMGLAATGFQLLQDAWYYRLPPPLRPVLALILQSAARLADRLEPSATRELNSMVFALVARKP